MLDGGCWMAKACSVFRAAYCVLRIACCVFRVREREPQNRDSFSYLYLANVLGATIGTLLTALVLIETVGFRSTLWVAAAGNFLVAGIAGRLAWRARNGLRTPEHGIRNTQYAIRNTQHGTPSTPPPSSIHHLASTIQHPPSSIHRAPTPISSAGSFSGPGSLRWPWRLFGFVPSPRC